MSRAIVRRVVSFLAAGLVWLPLQASAVAQWQRYEYELKTPVQYDQGNPYRDLQIMVQWSTSSTSGDLPAPTGFGFWDGTRTENNQTFNIFKIRTSLTQGTYYLWYKCSGVTAGHDCSTDPALNRSSSAKLSFQIAPNPSNLQSNLLYSKGFLSIPSGARYFTYTDDRTTRFYWQGDTAWASLAREGQSMLSQRANDPNHTIPVGAVTTNWKSYIDDRAAKGYTVVQVAPAVAWQASNSNEPVRAGCPNGNKSIEAETAVAPFPGPETFAFQQLSTTGCTGVIPNNCSRWRPDYWREVDAMVDYANSKGIVVLIAGVADPSDRGHCRQSEDYPTQADSVIFARSLAARMAGNHVIFSINFDDWPGAVLQYHNLWPGTVHDTTLVVGPEIRKVTPRHLISDHLAGGAAKEVYASDHNLSWLGFELYQSGHALNLSTTCPTATDSSWQSKQKCAVGRALDFPKYLRGLTPAKPVVNGEGAYEYPDQPAALPPDNQYGMRHTAHASLLSGSAGFTAGVFGDLGKNEDSIAGWNRPLSVLQTNGIKTDMPLLNRLLISLFPGSIKSWGELMSISNVLVDRSAKDPTDTDTPGERRIIAGTDGSGNYVAYVPNSSLVAPGSGLTQFDCSKWTVNWRSPRVAGVMYSICGPKRQPRNQFGQPEVCTNVKIADQKGTCDWAMVLQRPKSAFVQTSLYTPYVASALVEAANGEDPVLTGGGDLVNAQLMGSDDNPLAPATAVSTDPEANYGFPATAQETLTSSTWVVWEAQGATAEDSTDIFARRVGTDGAPLGTPFSVNQTTAKRQFDPFVVADAAGNVTVLWASMVSTDNPDKPKADIYGRRYRGDGTPLSDEYMVDLNTEKNQDSPAAGADAAGNLVAGWISKTNQIVVRLFSAAGAPRTGEIQVNSPSAALQRVELAEIAVDPLGGFVVRWNEYSNTDDVLGWYSRSFDANGQPLTGAVLEGP